MSEDCKLRRHELLAVRCQKFLGRFHTICTPIKCNALTGSLKNITHQSEIWNGIWYGGVLYGDDILLDAGEPANGPPGQYFVVVDASTCNVGILATASITSPALCSASNLLRLTFCPADRDAGLLSELQTSSSLTIARPTPQSPTSRRDPPQK